MSTNLSQLARRHGLNHLLFHALGEIKQEKGTISQEDIQSLADKYLVGTASIYGTASAYDFLKPDSASLKAFVCTGSSCMTSGTVEQIQDKLHHKLGEEAVGQMVCLGRCHENKAFHYKGKNYSGSDIDHLTAILDGEYPERNDDIPVYTRGTTILTGEALDAKTCLLQLTQALQSTPNELLKQIKASKLRGRGGAGFPMHIKLESVKNIDTPEKYIVCNADEGDPGAFSDRYLLEQQPFLLLLGMAITGYITGAKEGAIYLRAEYPYAMEVIGAAIKTFHTFGEIPTADGTTFSFKLYLVPAQGAYICGEETALLNSIEGQRPEVRTRPPFPTVSGLFGQPTVVNNVETLACVPYIIQNGGAAFASVGTTDSTGTKLISLDGFFQKPGLYEVPMGFSFGTLLYEMAGGFHTPVKAVQVGGPLCGVIPTSRINDLTIDFESFKDNGFLLGHAGVMCIPQSFPMIEYMQHLFAFTSHESCGKCFPCRIGAQRGAELVEKAMKDPSFRIEETLLIDLIETLELGSLCGLGGGVPLPLKNILTYFKEEIHPYFLEEVIN